MTVSPTESVPLMATTPNGYHGTLPNHHDHDCRQVNVHLPAGRIKGNGLAIQHMDNPYNNNNNLHASPPTAFPNEFIHQNPNLLFKYPIAFSQENNILEASTSMRLRHVVRIALCHLLLYTFVVVYILIGASIFHYMEGEKESRLHETQRESIQRLKRELIETIARTDKTNEIDVHLRRFMNNISAMHVSLDNYLIFNDPHQTAPKRWTFPASVLFAFTILTTIGYGNVAPTTYECQVFLMIYGAIGIPLFLITIADIGRFSKTGIMTLLQKLFGRELKKEGEQKCLREVAEVMLVIAILFGFIAAGSAVLPLWEHQLTYFDSVYFSYMSLTTIGLGDIVPRRMDFLLPTLLYITIGLWLTTAFVEQLADVFRLVHYAGRQVKNVKGITVWLGGKRLSVGTLIQTVCRKVGMSDHLIGQINWDKTMEQALAGVQPPLVPIFPWHFADFVEHDPPLIDLSVDLDEMDNYQGSFYCSQFAMKGTGKMSTPRRPSTLSVPLTRRHSDGYANGRIENGKH